MNEALLADLAIFVQVVLIDIVLAGDNALVVGMAAAGLAPGLRRRAIMLGIVVALLCRIVFAAGTMHLLEIIGLTLAGGLLLLWVAWKLWRELADSRAVEAATGGGEEAAAARPAKSYAAAVWQIAVADVSMSLDNVLAVAGAARDHFTIMIFGLVLSIGLMGAAASVIAKYLTKHRWLGYVGLAVIAYVAVEMIYRGWTEVVDQLALFGPA